MLYNHHSDVDKLESVDLIASGYDWDCPNCEHWNHEIETKDVVECDECHHIYQTGETHHAHGSRRLVTGEENLPCTYI